MSNNNGTGFWVVVALIAALSVAAIIGAAIGFVARTITRWTAAAAPSQHGRDAEARQASA